MKLDKGKVICTAYRNGSTISEIARAFGQDYNIILGYLQKYFEYFYGEPYKPFTERRAALLEELYKKYKEIYVQGLYSREQMCEMLNCNVNELEAMFRKYKLNNQWLKTYNGQATLCNTSKEFRNSVKDFAKKYGYKSVRAVAVTAINEFMLQQMLLTNKE